MRQPYSVWSSHLTGDRQKDFEDLLKNSTTVLERVRQLIDAEIASLERSDDTEESFNSPSWAYLQAYRNGGRAKLKRIRELFAFIPER